MEEGIKGFMAQLKAKSKSAAETQDIKNTAPSLRADCCPGCGAGRASMDGLTNCAYCGHSFISVKISGGIHLGPKDNSGEPY